MNVLFVDDEPRVLEALERSLFQLDVDWAGTFAESGSAALECLGQERFDVIVSDMRMPGMDGAALLDQVCKKYPHVVRIVLSGQTDEAAALRVVRVAHQFLSKPCSPDTLRQVIERTRELRVWLSDERLMAAVGRVDALPSAPRLFSELSAALEDENTSADSVANIVRQDPAMTSKILQVVNSSFFSSSATLSDVRVAVVRLGLKTIRNLTLGIGAFDALGKLKGPTAVFVEQLQRRSLAIAQLAGRIAKSTTNVDSDAAFMAGLVCDVGELILAANSERDPSASGSAHGAEVTDAEVTHAEVGAFLLGVWGLPFPIVEAVANHHRPARNAYERLGLPQVVWLSACLVEGNVPDPEYVRRIDAEELLSKVRGTLT